MFHTTHAAVRFRSMLLLVAMALPAIALADSVNTADDLIRAVNDGQEGDLIEIAAGTFALSAPLEPKAGMTLKGAGIDKTIITHVASWKPSTKSLPDPEIRTDGMDTYAYLLRLVDKAPDITISDLTLRGPQMHGAIFGKGNDNLHIHHVRIQDTLWSGIRAMIMQGLKVHDCEFIDAGGKWQRGGEPGVKGGISGGAIFGVYMKECEIANNRITRRKEGRQHHFFGVKIRGIQSSRIHHNTISVNFSIELPFENLEDVEIDHNVLHGAVSIPKYKGGTAFEIEENHSAHIHHNYFTTSYAIEYSRNAVEIDHNLFDFDTEDHGGNLISEFSKVPSPGPTKMHNNLIRNPGRGVFWSNGGYNRFHFYNNHVIANTTERQEGLFGLNPNGTDYKTIAVRDNIIECIDSNPRPLFRHDEAYGAAVVENNMLSNISDTAKYANPQTGKKQGPVEPLKFQCGVHGELTVDGWKTGSD